MNPAQREFDSQNGSIYRKKSKLGNLATTAKCWVGFSRIRKPNVNLKVFPKPEKTQYKTQKLKKFLIPLAKIIGH